MRRRKSINKFAYTEIEYNTKPMSAKGKKAAAFILSTAMHASMLTSMLAGNIHDKVRFDDGPREEISDDEKT